MTAFVHFLAWENEVPLLIISVLFMQWASEETTVRIYWTSSRMWRLQKAINQICGDKAIITLLGQGPKKISNGSEERVFLNYFLEKMCSLKKSKVEVPITYLK